MLGIGPKFNLVQSQIVYLMKDVSGQRSSPELHFASKNFYQQLYHNFFLSQ